MLYLYLDESGDLGFDFVNTKPSKYFTIAVLAVFKKEDNDKLNKAVKQTIRRKFSKNQKVLELKGSKCPIKIKEYLYNKLTSIDFKIYSVTLNKLKVFDQLRKDKERVYNYIARLVFEKVPFNNVNTKIEIIVDKSKNKKNIQEFNSYIINQIKGKFNPKIPLSIYHHDSMKNYG